MNYCKFFKNFSKIKLTIFTDIIIFNQIIVLFDKCKIKKVSKA